MSKYYRLENNIPKALKEYENVKERIMYAIGLQWTKNVTTIITSLRAVDTGRLAGSLSFSTSKKKGVAPYRKKDNVSSDFIKNKAGENQLIIGSNVEYASPVNNGSVRKYKSKDGKVTTVKTKARNFMTPSIMRHKKQYEQLAEEVLKGNI